MIGSLREENAGSVMLDRNVKIRYLQRNTPAPLGTTTNERSLRAKAV